MRPAKNSGSVSEIQSMNAKTRHRWLLLAGWLVMLLFCLTTSAWADEMTTNGTFTGNTDWTPGGASPLTYDAGTGAGSFIQAVAGVKNANVSGSIAQNVNIPIGATVTAVTIDAMHTITQGAPTDEIIIEIFTGGAYVEIFRGTNVGTSFAPVTDLSGALPYVLIANASEVRITATITGTNIKATEDLWIDDVSITYTSVDADNMLVSTSVPIATTAQPGLVDVQALRMSLNTATNGNGETVLSTLTIDDLFLEGEIDHIENLKIYIDDNSVYVDGTLGGVVTAAWDGTSTLIDFAAEPSLTVAERTITAGTPKYLWVVLDIHIANTNYSARPSITAITVEGTDLPPSGGPWSANIIGVTAGLGCGQCHPNPMEDDALNQRDPATGGVAGSHTKHAIGLGYDCDLCHNIKPIAPRHRNAYIGIVDPIAGQTNADYTTVGKAGVRQFGAYKDFPEVPDPVRGNCQNTLCHGGDTTAGDLGGPAGAGPQWGQRNDTDECTFCHNASKTNSGGLANAYPDTDSIFRSDAAATAHNLHMTSTLTDVTCDDCHTIYATITESGHIDTGVGAPADVPFPAGSAARFNTTTPDPYAGYVCGNLYCHGANMPLGEDGGSTLAPDWDTDNWANFPADCTTACHDLPPKTGSSSSNGSHAGVTAGDVTACTSCHSSTVTSNGNPPTMDPAFHINGTVEATGCTGCHGTDPNQYPPVSPPSGGSDGLGAHVAHIENSAGIISKEDIASGTLVNDWCAECHTTTRGDAGHDGAYPAEIAFTNAVEAKYNTTSASISPDAGAVGDGNAGDCTVYCHGANMPKGDTSGTNRIPDWADNTIAGTCDPCHGTPPTAGTSAAIHSGQAFPGSCKTCHGSTVLDTSNPPTLDPAFHINGTVEATGCTGCHGTDPKEYPPVSPPSGGADGEGAHVKHIESTTLLLTKEAIGGEADTTGYWCAECHTTTRGDAGHDGAYPAEIVFTNAIEAKYNSTSASFSAATGGSSGPSDGTGGSCNVYCHGDNMPNGDTAGSNRAPKWTDNLTGCGTCHGFPPTPAGTHSGITLETQCGGCHTATMTDTASGITVPANHINGSVEVVVTCTGCHSSAAHSSGVGVGSPHLKLVRGGPDQDCVACHPGGTVGSTHTLDHANVIQINDNLDLGIDYAHQPDGSNDGFVLGGENTIASPGSEAEICWGCHDDSTPDISEWDGPTAAYDYGSVDQNNLNWTTTNWQSAQFAYKNGVLSNKPTVASPVTGTADGGSTHGTNGGIAGVDTVDKIGCTFCHDVHDTTGPSGSPYVRGTWQSNPYKEDGAPRSGAGQTIDSGGMGLVPRGLIVNNYGGYQIDQNNGSPALTADSAAGLCELCHGDGGADGSWTTAELGAIGGSAAWVSTGNSHAYVVKGGLTSGGYNLYDEAVRLPSSGFTQGPGLGGGGNAGFPSMAYQHHQEKTEGYGFRGTDARSFANEMPALPDISGASRPYYAELTAGNYAWGATVDDTTVDGGFHQFSCSKCHNPHASRLPRLMITNCLDTKVNTWDDTLVVPSVTNSYASSASTTVSAENVNVDLSNASSAQNCHRLKDQTNAGGNGWNTATPW